MYKIGLDNFPCKHIDLQPSHLKSPGRFTFGTSRESMRPYHVDKVFRDAKAGIAAPSPDRYQLPKSCFENKTPNQPTMGKRRHILMGPIKKTNEPGPGSTEAPSMTGEAAFKIASSMHRSVDKVTFGKAMKEPMRPQLIDTDPGVTTPIPDFLNPGFCKAPITCKFTRGNLDIFHKEWGLKEDALKPGPGQYKIASEFDH